MCVVSESCLTNITNSISSKFNYFFVELVSNQVETKLNFFVLQEHFKMCFQKYDVWIFTKKVVCIDRIWLNTTY